MEEWSSFSLNDLQVMLGFCDPRFTEITRRRRFGFSFSKKEVERAIKTKLEELCLLGEEDTRDSIEIKESEDGEGNPEYGNHFGT